MTRRRTSQKLRGHYRAILGWLGLTLALVGGVTLVPLAALAFAPHEYPSAIHFVVPAGLLIAGGTAVFFRCRPRQVVLTVQDAGLIVVFSWLGACFAGTWPLMALEHLTFTHAFFESVSGWTTTGLSVVDVTTAAHLTLLWRSTMQLVGGAGFAIIMLAALIGPSGTGLAIAEGRSEQLVPHVRQSAKIVLWIYSGYTVVGIAAYRLAGMDLFDAVNHAFCAVSTGGFSTRATSIGWWDSVAIEAVSLPLMFLGNFNFLVAYLLWRGRLRSVARDGELRMFAVMAPVSALLLLLLVCQQIYPRLGKSIRVAMFEAVTALTTTGYSTVGYEDWNAFGIVVLLVLMLIGGGVGSTAGGLKQFRIYLLVKAIGWEIRRALLPPSAVVEESIWHGENREYIGDRRIRQVAVFTAFYLLAFAGGTAVLAAHGYSLSDSLFEFASTQGTVGLSVGLTSPDAPRLVHWTQIAGMFCGRLEFFVIFITLAKLLRDVPELVVGAGGPRR